MTGHCPAVIDGDLTHAFGEGPSNLALLVELGRRTGILIGVDAGDANSAGGLDHLHERVDYGFFLVRGDVLWSIAVTLEADAIDGGVDPTLTGTENSFDLIGYGRAARYVDHLVSSLLHQIEPALIGIADYDAGGA
jgi:hypothetical protein